MQTVTPPESNQTPAAPDVVGTFSEGQKLGGCYLLRRKIESADATTIWLAHDEVLGKDVSLHFIPAALRGDEKVMEELRIEAKRNRQLIHPNILRVYDFIEESDWAAISMDYFEGESIAVLRRKKPGAFFEVAEVRGWGAQLCQTIEDAHKIQLFHRDISPANVFVENGGRLLVANFGIGRCIRDGMSRLGGSVESAENASPQQLDGQRATVSDDVYAMGVLFHEMLAGGPPFTGADVAGQIRKTTAATIQERRAQGGKGGGPIPHGWEKVVAACLEKAPEQRPRSVNEIAVRLGFEKSGKGAAVVSEPAPVAAAAVVMADPAPAKSAEPEPVFSFKKSEPEPDPELQPELKTSVERFVPDHYPNMNPRRSGFPITGLAAALLLFAFCIYGFFFRDSGKAKTDGAEIAAESPASGTELTAVTNSNADTTVSAKAPVADATPVVVTNSESAAPVVNATAQPVAESPAIVVAAKAKPATPAPEPPKAATPAPAAPVGESTLAAKTAALDVAKKAVEAAGKAHQDLVKQKELADAAVAEAKRALDDKTKAALPVLKAAEEVAAMRLKREEEMRAADLAAQEAQKLAAEKARLAEEAKKAVASVETESKDKLMAMQKAETDLNAVKKAVADKEQLAADATRLADDANAKREAQLTVVKTTEAELAMAKAAADKAAEEAAKKTAEMEMARKAQAEKKSKIEKEMEDARKMFEERMKALEAALKAPDETVPPAPPVAPKSETKPAIPPPSANAAPTLPPADSTLLVKADPPKMPTVAVVDTKELKPSPAPASGGFTNSLGMKFAPVGDVEFCVWQTRVKDFESFATATGLKSAIWRDPGFKQAPEHPVVNVTWMEAIAFCKWLTFKEQREGVLQAGQAYRLPTDLEWSKAVGLPEESGKNPEARDMGVPDVYPWGTQWPPPPGAGNYTGEETGSDVAIKGYEDGFPWTAPVGSFPPNKLGLYDMGGNVWQWVMDPWAGDPKSKALRGASWYNGALKLSLLSSCRVHAAQDSSTDNYGFRVVLANEGGKPVKR